MGRFPGLKLGLAALLVGCIAGLGDLGGNLFFVLASAEGELAVVIVLTSLYPVVTAILARIFLHERLGPLRVLGVALAITGVVLIGLPADAAQLNQPAPAGQRMSRTARSTPRAASTRMVAAAMAASTPSWNSL